MRLFLLIRATSLTFAVANVEKTVFTAPQARGLPKDASIDNLLLDVLTPDNPSVRTFLNASFPTGTLPEGTETWLLLADLQPGQRYESRVCWMATQPTAFLLTEYTMEEVVERPELISSLSTYAYSRHEAGNSHKLQGHQPLHQHQLSRDTATTFLFLHVRAAADYFTLDTTLMTHVEPVYVDIILDPFLFNLLPRSLISTTCLLLVIVILAWALSSWISTQVSAYAQSGGAKIARPVAADKKRQ